MKQCSRCQVEKGDDQFGRNEASQDGLQGYCRDCMREYNHGRYKKKQSGWVRKTADKTAYMRQYRKDHPEYYREKDKKKYDRRMKVLRGNDYVVGDPANREGLASTPEQLEFATKRRQAKSAVRSAIRNGSLVKLPCWCCGAERLK
jgi:hypothetical protein